MLLAEQIEFIVNDHLDKMPKSEISQLEMEVYGRIGVGSVNVLSSAEMNANAEYIFSHLRDLGWSKEAIAALLGNIQHESYLNPGQWQFNQETGNSVGQGGYGLLQWTNYRKFLDWANLTVEATNKLAVDNPKRLIDLQLEFLIDSSSRTADREWLIGNVTTDKSQHNPPGNNRNLPTRYGWLIN